MESDKVATDTENPSQVPQEAATEADAAREEPKKEEVVVDRELELLESLKAANAMREKKASSERESSSAGSRIKFVSIFLSVILFILLIALLLRPRLPDRSPYLPIPYVFNTSFLKTLRRYISLPSHNQILVISGPPGIGKTRGLVEFALELNNTGYTPVIVDIAKFSIYPTAYDLKNYFLQSIFKAFQLVDGRSFNVSLLNSQYYVRSSTAPVEGLSDITLIRIFNVLNNTMNGFEKSPAVVIKEFLEVFETFNDYLKPVLIVNSPNKLLASESTAAIKCGEGLFNYFESFISNTHVIPVIVEINNLLAPSNQRIIKSPVLYKFLEVGPFDYEISKTIFVELERVWKLKVFNSIKEELDGYGHLYAQLHDLTREGFSISNAINEIVMRQKSTIVKATVLNSNKNDINTKRAFLKRFVKRGSIPVNEMNPQIAKIYLDWNIIYCDSTMKLHLANKLMIRSLKLALKVL